MNVDELKERELKAFFAGTTFTDKEKEYLTCIGELMWNLAISHMRELHEPTIISYKVMLDSLTTMHEARADAMNKEVYTAISNKLKGFGEVLETLESKFKGTIYEQQKA